VVRDGASGDEARAAGEAPKAAPRRWLVTEDAALRKLFAKFGILENCFEVRACMWVCARACVRACEWGPEVPELSGADTNGAGYPAGLRVSR
jgi:hypothetical protein